MEIRAERDEDHAAVRHLNESAFGPGSPEAGLVEALRANGAHVAALCLVAVDGDEVIGHIFYSRARLESGHEVLALAPMAVLPERQRSGVGKALVEASLALAAQTDYPLVVVLGHPEYYPRFGFEPAAGYGVVCPWEVPAEAWMLLPLPAHRPEARGRVTYAAPFDAVT